MPSLVASVGAPKWPVMLPLILFRLMSWLVALFLMLWQLHLLMQTCLPSDDASDASDASVATVNSSNCDLQSPDEIPVISAVLAAQDVTDVLLADLSAPLVTISLEEKALAPAASSVP